MAERVSRPNIDLKVVMDQSVFVRQSIKSLVQEGVTGGFFCVLVILLFLGQWKMTAIAGMTLPLSVLVSITCLYATGNTINVMTLAGLTLAIGPMVDSAVICLENTERHLSMGSRPEEAAFLGASQVALPELVSTHLHAPGPLAAGPDLRAGHVPLQADGAGGHVLHDRRLHPVADPGPGLLGRLAEGARRPRGPHRKRPEEDDGERETFQIEDGRERPRRGIVRAALGASGKAGSTRSSAGTSGSSTGCSSHRVAVVADGGRPAGRLARRDLPGPLRASSTPTSTRAPSR